MFEICRFVMNALKAKEFYRRDVQYIVKNGQALIINEVGPEFAFYPFQSHSSSLLIYYFSFLPLGSMTLVRVSC